MNKVDLIGQIDREELKKEIKNEMRHDENKSKLRRFFWVAGLLMFLLIASFVFCAILLAKSGWVRLPLLTKLFYKPIAASRVVTPLSGTNTATLLAAMAMRAAFNPNIGTLQLALSEQELTTIINTTLRQPTNSLPFVVESAQIVLDTGSVELFALTEHGNGIKVPFLVKMLVSARNGQLQIDPERVVIGGLIVPSVIASHLTGLVSGRLTDGFSRIFFGSNLKNIKITFGRIDITVNR